MSFYVFFQTEHLPLQTQKKEREICSLPPSVSSMVMLSGSAQLELLAHMLIKISLDVHKSSFYSLFKCLHCDLVKSLNFLTLRSI